MQSFYKMVLDWVAVLLLAWGCAAQDSSESLSERCANDTRTFLRELNQERPAEYAVLMYDAFGKMGSNVKGGNEDQPGSVQQCRSAHAPNFSAHYCKVSLKQGPVEYFEGICVPDSCSEDELETLVLHATLQMGGMSLIPPLPSILVNETTQELVSIRCLSSTIVPQASDIVCLFVCCVMVAIPLAATLFAAIIKWRRNKEVSPSAKSSCLHSELNLYGTMKSGGSSTTEPAPSAMEENSNNAARPGYAPPSWLSRWLQAFSLQSTSQGVLSTSSTIQGQSYSSLNGIRVLSLFWIMSGHSTELILAGLDNSQTWIKAVVSSPLYVLSLGGPFFLAVDTFLLLGGLLSARSLLGAIDRDEDRLSPRLVAVYLLNRIKRIQPLHVFITLLTTGIVSLVQWGPYWFPFVDIIMDCKSYWWANVVLVSNIIPVQQICVPWTWYLSLDFQCYLTTPLLVYFYRLNQGVFTVVAGGLLLSTTIASAAVTALMQLPVFQPSTTENEHYLLSYYLKPHTRYGPFLIGILTGMYLKRRKGPLVKQKWQAALGWLLCFSLMAALVQLAYVLKETPPYPSTAHALYQGLHRCVWVLAVTWIILACEDGYGGFIQSLMTLSIWVPLSNISFACYLIHPLFILIYLGWQETPIHYTDLNFMYLFFGHLVLSLGVSFALHLLIERPFLLLKLRSTQR
ncbi:O-acyltransferase like protein isoform X1 [Takifugu flavidus]|uniref:O-acyltransferase like protein isoform X1 n=1 Tax=Takifugu flavidus TaxID=433684 RepID=UPI0025447E9D|nr:O-acyltransferase like protein isoform X1 [Takifugu flavidus]